MKTITTTRLQRSDAPSAVPSTGGRCAFTRLELTALLALLTLLAAVAWPALANPRPRSQRLICVSNLREIGQGFASWSSEHGNRLPSQVLANEGGNWRHLSGLQNVAWFQLVAISNHLRSPRVFFCPSDSAKREASNFAFDPNGGFLHANHQDNALSYLLGHPLWEARPDVLAGDRNITEEFQSGGCRYWSPTHVVRRGPGATVRWTEALHNGSGNVLLSDGRVEQLSSLGLRERLAEGASENASEFHYLSP